MQAVTEQGPARRPVIEVLYSEPPAEYTLACRVYRLEHRVAGQPDERWVREALLRAGRT